MFDKTTGHNYYKGYPTPLEVQVAKYWTWIKRALIVIWPIIVTAVNTALGG